MNRNNYWPIGINQLRKIQLEITSFCNAKCPSCQRQNELIEPSPYVSKINSNFVSIYQIQKWFNKFELKNLKYVKLCGNIDEPTLNPDILKIIDYFNKKNILVTINTNGGTNNSLFWKKLAKKNVHVIFSIDGLSDTNHIYRVNLKWEKIQNNFREYIKNEGHAIWQFIVFDHNQHQLEEAEKLSKKEGFKSFKVIISKRGNENVNSVEIRDENIIKTYQHKTSKNKMILNKHFKDDVILEESKNNIICKAQCENSSLDKSVYITVDGDVFPCCWMGTNLYKQEFSEKISKKFGDKLSNNLNYIHLNEILDGDIFSELNNNFDKMEVCNNMCIQDREDVFWTKMN